MKISQFAKASATGSSRASNPSYLGLAIWTGLLTFALSQIASTWGYFPSLIADQGWYLQVAYRISQGDVLYREIAWAYGPLPAHALATLFRLIGAHAWLATLVNGTLALLSVPFTYAAVRALLPKDSALIIVAFATVCGSYVGADLIRAHLFAFTQAIAWGSVASLAALVSAITWSRTLSPWPLVPMGAASGLALLSKPEFALVAVGTSLFTLGLVRAPRRAWTIFLLATVGVVILGFAESVQAAGVGAVWRGYSGYDQLTQRQLWGTQPGALFPLRWFAGVYCFWLAVLFAWASRRWPRWRRVALTGVVLWTAAALLMMIPFLTPSGGTAALVAMLNGRWSDVQFEPLRTLPLLVGLPWGPIFIFLLIAAWSAWRKGAPEAWWIIWIFSVISNLRWVMTGFASMYAFAPALALLWWLFTAESPADKVRHWQPILVGALCLLAVLNLWAQLTLPGTYLSMPRVELDTEIGRVTVGANTGHELQAVQALIQREVPVGETIFAPGWGTGWYLIAERANPTVFDAVLAGLGTSGHDASQLQAQLLRDPPAAVILPSSFWPSSQSSGRQSQDGEALQRGLPEWWDSLPGRYSVEPVPGVSNWVVLLRRAD